MQSCQAQRFFTGALLVYALIVGAAAPAAAQLRSRVYASGFSAPIAFVQDPTDPTVQFVVEQGGRIRAIRNGVILTPDFLNLSSTAILKSGGEQGLLGMALAPDYAVSGRFYVNFTNPAGHTVIARFKRSANPLIADPATQFDLHWGGPGNPAFIAQPFANHNGGHLAFGPDGYLYIGLGDGGSGNDPDHRAQNPAELLGKMLRIDVNVPDGHAFGYAVPADNPFVGNALPGIRTEIWAFGLRNPWRYNFDDVARGGTGALFIGDVGQNAWEEIDVEPRGRGGRNYGWRNREGAHDNVINLPPAYLPLADPIHEYDHGSGNAVTGGFVYRGTALGAGYQGRYFFADFGSGRVWSLLPIVNAGTGEAQSSTVTEHTTELGGQAVVGNVSAFGVDSNGELYLVSYSSGRILAIERPAGSPGVTVQPLSAVRVRGQGVIFTAAATGTPTPSVRWQLSTNGASTWTDVPFATAPSFRLSTGAATQDGTLYRAVFTNAAGATPSAPATLTIRRVLPNNLDGDTMSDLMVWRPSNGNWFWLTSGTDFDYAQARSKPWGTQTDGDVPLLGDIDGDGLSDLVLWRASTGTWYWLTSSSGFNYAAFGSKQWGAANDKPMLADMDGDGKSDLIVWRPSNGTFYWLTSRNGYNYAAANGKQWGSQAEGDRPFAGDVDRDGLADLIVWRASTGTWFWLASAEGFNYTNYGTKQYGDQSLGDIPLVGDLNADGLLDFVIWRASTGTFYWLLSPAVFSGPGDAKQWGSQSEGDVPLLIDADGDGSLDLTVWRASTGTWYWLPSSSHFTYAAGRARQWGAPGDIPIVK